MSRKRYRRMSRKRYRRVVGRHIIAVYSTQSTADGQTDRQTVSQGNVVETLIAKAIVGM